MLRGGRSHLGISKELEEAKELATGHVQAAHSMQKEQPRRGFQAREYLACLRTSQGPWLQRSGEDRVVQLWGEREERQGDDVGPQGRLMALPSYLSDMGVWPIESKTDR